MLTPRQTRGFLIGEYLLLALLLVGVVAMTVAIIGDWINGEFGLAEIALTGIGCFLITLVLGDLRRQRRRARMIEDYTKN